MGLCDTPNGSRSSGPVRWLRATGVVAALAVTAGVGLADAHSSVGTKPPTVPAPDRAAAAVLAAAHAHLGDRYVWGGSGPHTWDCSGLTSTMWRAVGGVASIPRTAAQQQAWATPVPADQARPGDLVFFGRPVSHVALYEGAGWVLDASASHAHVIERPLWTSAVTFGRVPRATAPRVRVERGQPARVPAPSRLAATSTASRAPHEQRPDALGARFVAALRARVGLRYAIGGVGPRAYDDAALLSRMWKRVIGHGLPLDRNDLASRTVAIPRSRLAPGDVLVYGRPGHVWHVAVYVGHGRMVDASRSLGHVVLRPVLASSQLHYGRLHRR